MLRNLLISIFLVSSLTLAFAPPALAVNCDFNTCMNICGKGRGGGALQRCVSWCQISLEERKKSGQCK